MTLRTMLALGLSLGMCGSVWAADPKPPAAAPEKKKEMPTFLTVEEAGPDYKVQGEYGDAEAGKAKFGVQVIALSDDKFRAVVYPGGLPGAGWSGDKQTKVEIDGRRAGDKIAFEGKGWKAEITDGGSIKLTGSDGESVTLNKVMRQSPTMGAKPPAGAKVLYAGPEDVKNWNNNAHADGRGLLAAGCSSKDKFKDFTLHAEFFLPYRPAARGQERGNSGVYLQDRYECQVLDSFGLKGEDNECGGFYKQFAPSVNMCLPPLEWQSYDIDFTAAKFDESGKKTAKATATVRHNGVVVQDHIELDHPTPGGGLSGKDTADPGPIQLQGHGNPVFYRNIWIVEK
ncbi:MAG: hypothetical protein JWN40_5462 [Phycisphaerales bacterium]|nr:hypothetical protein [Phycisphaerales bacterium]